MIRELSPEQLYHELSGDELNKALTLRPTDTSIIFGQERASNALQLGFGMKAEGFNVYVCGVKGSGKLTTVKDFLEKCSLKEPVPPDWCYVNNFNDAYCPLKLKLPPGKAVLFKKDMKALIDEALSSLNRVFESEEYAMRRQQIGERFEEQQKVLTASIQEKAAKESLEIKQTPWEIFTIPLLNGTPMTDKQFKELPEAQQESIKNKQDQFGEEIKAILQQARKLEKEAHQEFAKLDQDVAGNTITAIIRETEDEYRGLPEILEYLQLVKQDILNNLSAFLESGKTETAGHNSKTHEFLKRYQVNVLVDNTALKGAPIIIERNPTYNNLIGRVEKESVMGTLVTDFTMIRKGSLHSANGGYLIIRAEELFKNYFSWEALKRALHNKEITIEEATDQLGYLTTKTLKPEAMPLQVKVVLIGNPYYFQLLYALDSDFKVLFKVKADFDTEMERSPENISHYLALCDRTGTAEELKPIDNSARSVLIEYGSRLAEDQQKLSTRVEELADILREAHFYAKQENAAAISRAHMEKAIEQKTYRSNLIQEKINELIVQQQLLIDITGEKAGQVNGLSVINLGDISFGKPNRITCTTNVGKAGIVTIEREAEMSGPIHTKGVLILTGYLAETFFRDKTVNLSARIVFEQSYSEVEGDSASSTELYALLSSLANLPIKQGIAVTGSVNQKGEVQAIGGVNEKIEGFFELCRLKGLNGQQGVLIPSANIRNLMLKKQVRDAVIQKQFHIWTADHVNDGIELLTGVRAGSSNEEGSVHALVNKTLLNYAQKMKEEQGEAEEEIKPIDQQHWVSSVV